MKCKRCGYSCRDINGMRKHYLKKHPGAMKKREGVRHRRKTVIAGDVIGGEQQLYEYDHAKNIYCPHCHKPIGRAW